jgi:hypothetical protein
LLDSVLTTKVDARVRDQIVAETHGNPLALVKLPHELAAAPSPAIWRWTRSGYPTWPRQIRPPC